MTPLKILIILENAGAGSGRHVLDLTTGLLQKGHLVTILYSPSRLEPWFEKSIKKLSGLKSCQIDMVRGPGFQDFKSFFKICRYISQHGPFDIIHGHSSKGGALASLVAIGKKGRSIFTPHAFYTMDQTLSLVKHNLYRLIEIFLSKFADTIICVSQYECDHGLALGIDAGMLRVVNNGIPPLSEPDRNAARQKLGLTPNDICIGFVGRLAHQKGLERLLESFAKIHLQAPSACLAIVGSGDNDDDYREMTRHFQVSDKIIWAGNTNGAAIMAAFDIFALPSRYEAFPYVLLEAGARKLPIITMHVGGADEIVHPGVNGYIIPQGDLDGFASHLLELCKNKEMRKSMGDNSAKIVAEFSIDQMVEKTLKIYRNDK